MKILKINLTIATALLFASSLCAQTYFTKEGTISFYSHTPLEEIEAVNEKAVSIIDLDDAKVEFSVLIKGFLFKNALMQTHFNENYMESDQYPKAIFKSTNVDFKDLDIEKEGAYTVPVTGVLTVKGKDKEVTSEVTFEVRDNGFSAECNFVVSPDDFNIEIPSLVRGKIAEEIEVKVVADYQLYTKS